MENLQNKLAVKIDAWKKEVKDLLAEHGEFKLTEVSVQQAYGGMRGVMSIVCDTSRVPADEGLIIREIPIKDLTEKTPEEVFYLLLMGELPNTSELKQFSDELKKRKDIPDYVWNVIKSMPEDSHPMTLLNAGILAMQKDSVFAKKYNEGMKKQDYWKATLEDALNLTAKLPALAGGVYRIKFKKGSIIKPDSNGDMSSDYVKALGLPDPDGLFKKLMGLYLVLHSDHEGGNVSALTTATVNSALSDIYYSVSAGLNGLAGPLHGLANQESLKWILETNEKFGGKPTKEQIQKYAEETLSAGKVIPGYGHAVLRVVDPRFTAFVEFGKKYCNDDPVFQTVSNVFDVVPDMLKQVHKIKDPWPNVDAASGSLLYHFGLTEYVYYTVVFGVARAIGLTSQAVIARALEFPIIRPKSVTAKWIKQTVSKN